jgi:head-tail adaptor
VAVRAGELRTPLTLEEPSETVVAGEATVVWTDRGMAWGKIEAEGGSEGRLTAEASYQITMRYHPTITARWRIGVKGTTRKFTITGPPVDPDFRRRELLLAVMEIKA